MLPKVFCLPISGHTQIHACGFLASLTIALLGSGCAGYNPRPLVIKPAAVPATVWAAHSSGIDLHMVSFNVWGLPRWMNWASSDRYARISRELESLHPDLILLQEVWTKRALHSAPAGPEWFAARSSGQANFFQENGLLTISKHPIVGGEFHPFHAAALPDSLVKKGALKVTIELPGGQRLNVWNVHLQAGNAQATRSRQIAELVTWVRAAVDGQIADVVAGDFNCTPDSPQYRTLCEQIGPSAQSISGAMPFATFDGLSKKPGAGRALDHAFIRLWSGAEGVQAQPRVLFTAKRLRDRLSDHLGFEVDWKLAVEPLAYPPFQSLAAGPIQSHGPFRAAAP